VSANLVDLKSFGDKGGGAAKGLSLFGVKKFQKEKNNETGFIDFFNFI
jgi:hypothetical protein